MTTDGLSETDRRELVAILKEEDPGTEIPPSALGSTVANREAFPDYHRKLRVVTEQIERLSGFVSGMPEEKRDAVWQVVYWEAMPAIRDKLTILAFGRIPERVRRMMDDPAYMRLVCSPGVPGAVAKSHLRRAIADLIVAPSSARLLEKATERPSVPERVAVERLDAD